MTSRRLFGPRMAQHVRQGLTETHAMLLYRADDLRDAIEDFLVGHAARAGWKLPATTAAGSRSSRNSCS